MVSRTQRGWGFVAKGWYYLTRYGYTQYNSYEIRQLQEYRIENTDCNSMNII